MKAIVYESNTGFTKQYALMLSEKSGKPAYDLKTAKKQLKKGDEIFFLGWIFGSKIMGLKKANRAFKIVGGAGVGITDPSNGYKHELIDKNHIKFSNFYYLRGGMDTSKLTGIKKKLITVLAQSIERDVATKTAKKEDKQLLKIVKNGANFVDEKYLASILKVINS